jgi:hypothetical protein
MPFVQRASLISYCHPALCSSFHIVLLRIPCCWQSTLVVAVGFAVGKQSRTSRHCLAYPPPPRYRQALSALSARTSQLSSRVTLPSSPLRHYVLRHRLRCCFISFAYVDVSFAICLWSPRRCLPHCPIAIDCPPYRPTLSCSSYYIVPATTRPCVHVPRSRGFAGAQLLEGAYCHECRSLGSDLEMSQNLGFY